jgi:hypothetical protein
MFLKHNMQEERLSKFVETIVAQNPLCLSLHSNSSLSSSSSSILFSNENERKELFLRSGFNQVMSYDKLCKYANRPIPDESLFE